jgi:purine-binding chemotaxis protein CheW
VSERPRARHEGPSWEALLGGAAGLPVATEEVYQRDFDERREQGGGRRFLTFMLAREEFALGLLRIREIIKVRPITEVPRAPAFVVGIISVRGTIVPVLDLRRRLGHPAPEPGPAARILIVTREDEPYGLVVDEVVHVVRLHAEDIEPPPPVVGPGEAEFVSGIGRPPSIMMPGAAGERLLIILALDAVLTFEVAVAAGRRAGERR